MDRDHRLAVAAPDDDVRAALADLDTAGTTEPTKKLGTGHGAQR